MDVLERVTQLCKKKGMSISQLEKDLDYGNGSLAKSKSMSADRMYKIAQYFGVSMEYLLTGKTLSEADSEASIIHKQQGILMEINKINQQMANYYKKISECQYTLNSLQQEYSKLESKKKKEDPFPTPQEVEPFTNEEDESGNNNRIWALFGNENEELPFN